MSVADVLTSIAPGLTSLAVGTGSALLPLINAEAYVIAAATRLDHLQLIVVVLAVALGQTAGKLAYFEGGRRGATRFEKYVHPTAPHRWTARVTKLLTSTRSGIPLVLTSAVVGLPPLAVVSVSAGAAGQPRWHFALACALGRSVRFAAVALPLSYAVA